MIRERMEENVGGGIRLVLGNVTRWYGQVIGVNDVSMEVGPGVTGLLGPNGAGKTTLINMLTGRIRPNQGVVRVGGVDPFVNLPLRRVLGYVPEGENLPREERGFSFLRSRALLRGWSPSAARERAEEMLARAGLDKAGRRRIGSYSKGMRQRLKLAQALLHRPRVIIMDEPLTGLDPVGRHEVIEEIKALGKAGCTVFVSSHVLHEIELMTDRVVLLARGKVLAEGTIEHIRSLIDAHPHTVEIRVDRPRELAVDLILSGTAVSVDLAGDGGSLRVRTREPDRFYARLNTLVLEKGYEVERFSSPDNNLQAVFDYLVK